MTNADDDYFTVDVSYFIEPKDEHLMKMKMPLKDEFMKMTFNQASLLPKTVYISPSGYVSSWAIDEEELPPDRVLVNLIPAMSTRVMCPEEICKTRAQEVRAYNEYNEQYDLGFVPVPISQCQVDGFALWQQIIHFNDVCGWNRERIADWLDTLDLDLSFPTQTEQDQTERKIG